MPDIIINPRRDIAVVTCETEHGRRFMAANFTQKIEFIQRDLLEEFIEYLREMGMEVEVI